MNRTDEMVIKFREVLKETEHLDPGGLWDYQKSLLTPLLLHARAHSPFYRKRLGAVFDGDEIQFDRWREIPLLTREDANRQRMRLRADAIPPHLGKVKEEETSGSLGRPMRYFTNDLVNVAALAMTDRLYRWWNFDGTQPIVNFVSPRMAIANPEGTTTHGWRSGFMPGLNHVRQSTGDMQAHVEWLEKIRPRYMVCYASMLRPLAETALERGAKLTISKIISRGGVVDDEMWKLCRDAFGADLVDQYGANEIGQIACQCPDCDSYHVSAEAVLVEVLDDNGNPAAAGQSGRVVLTSLYNYAMPFIRYEIGDRAELGSNDKDCNVALPRLQQINGRYRNNFTLSDGSIIFPNPPMSGFRRFFSYDQLQVVQTGYEEIEVRYVPGPEDRAADEAGLQRWLGDELGVAFAVRLVEVTEMPAQPSGKFEDFVSLVEDRKTPAR